MFYFMINLHSINFSQRLSSVTQTSLIAKYKHPFFIPKRYFCKSLISFVYLDRKYPIVPGYRKNPIKSKLLPPAILDHELSYTVRKSQHIVTFLQLVLQLTSLRTLGQAREKYFIQVYLSPYFLALRRWPSENDPLWRHRVNKVDRLGMVASK